jgi:hypothetical protein
MDESEIFYIKSPKSELIVSVLILLIQPIILFLIPNKMLVIIWFNLAIIFFGFHLLKLLLINIFKRSYFLLNQEGIIRVDPFGLVKRYFWNDFKGYLLIENILFIQFNNKNVKIINSFLNNGNINQIIHIIEKYKVDITYDKE